MPMVSTIVYFIWLSLHCSCFRLSTTFSTADHLSAAFRFCFPATAAVAKPATDPATNAITAITIPATAAASTTSPPYHRDPYPLSQQPSPSRSRGLRRPSRPVTSPCLPYRERPDRDSSESPAVIGDRTPSTGAGDRTPSTGAGDRTPSTGAGGRQPGRFLPATFSADTAAEAAAGGGGRRRRRWQKW